MTHDSRRGVPGGPSPAGGDETSAARRVLAAVGREPVSVLDLCDRLAVTLPEMRRVAVALVSSGQLVGTSIEQDWYRVPALVKPARAAIQEWARNL